jgi:triacylglycerol lipase
VGTIVLAHGLFGFGDLLPTFLSFLPSVHYFNEVAEHLRDQGHIVFEPQVNPIGSIQDRGDQLAAKILKQIGSANGIHILAHSMGGLDARHAITNRNDLVQRVATLVTIGTPHRGSPVADAIVTGAGPLFENIPDFLKQKLQQNAGALHDLTTGACIPFDEATPDAGGVRYINVAGDSSLGDDELLLFKLAAEIGRITGETNDGVVTKSSALRAGNQHLADWPVDHAGEIGWTLKLRPTPDHLARYDAIVSLFEASSAATA